MRRSRPPHPPARIAVRDSKHPQGPALLLPPEAVAALLDHVRS
ncbi:DUF397 domain-containing protein [Streptomyces sp. ADMS]